MPRARRRFAVVFFATGLSLFSSKGAYPQVQSISHFTATASRAVIPLPCRDRRPVPGTRRVTGSEGGTTYSDNLCDTLAADRSATGSSRHADVTQGTIEDPALEELKAMGERGLIIERAREEVIEILEGNNRCAAWFKQAEPNATGKFRSLRYTIDESGPQYTLKVQNPSGEWLYQQPYMASSIEDASPGSTITINGKGAFFQLRAGVRIVPKYGGPAGLSGSELLHLDLYVGGTLDAQVTTLLHEFSHVVGLLPADGESVSGQELSTQNTQVVLRHCRGQVEAAGKHKSVDVNREGATFPRSKQ